MSKQMMIRILIFMVLCVVTYVPPVFADDGFYVIPVTKGGDGHSLDSADGALIDVVYVDNAGNVGVGTTNPTEKLTVQGRIGSADWVLNVGGTTNARMKVRHIDGKHHESSDLDHLHLQHDVNYHTFLNTGTSTGNVGIGTTNPLSKLAVSGLPTEAPDTSGNAGMVCVTNDGNFWLDNDGTYDCQ